MISPPRTDFQAFNDAASLTEITYLVHAYPEANLLREESTSWRFRGVYSVKLSPFQGIPRQMRGAELSEIVG